MDHRWPNWTGHIGKRELKEEPALWRHTYLAERLTVIKEAVPLGRGCSIALRDG